MSPTRRGFFGTLLALPFLSRLSFAKPSEPEAHDFGQSIQGMCVHEGKMYVLTDHPAPAGGSELWIHEEGPIFEYRFVRRYPEKLSTLTSFGGRLYAMSPRAVWDLNL